METLFSFLVNLTTLVNCSGYLVSYLNIKGQQANFKKRGKVDYKYILICMSCWVLNQPVLEFYFFTNTLHTKTLQGKESAKWSRKTLKKNTAFIYSIIKVYGK